MTVPIHKQILKEILSKTFITNFISIDITFFVKYL